MPKKTVTVHITVVRKVTYSSIVKISQSDFERFSQAWGQDGEIDEELNQLIDTDDWQDDELYSVEEFAKDDA